MDRYIIKLVVTIAVLDCAAAGSYNSHKYDKAHHHSFDYDHGDWSDESSHNKEWSSSQTVQPNWRSGYHHVPDYSNYQKDYGHYSRDHYPQNYGYLNKHTHTADCHHDSQDYGYPGKGYSSDFGEWQGQPKWVNGQWVFPDSDQDNKYGLPWSPSTPSSRATRPPSTTSTPSSANGSGGTTPTPLTILLCIRSCPITSEYNPVCGSNNVTYSNQGRLDCARSCGVNVTMQRQLPCNVPMPSASNRTTTTPRPTNATNVPLPPVKPTRYTTITVVPGTTSRPVTPPNNDNSGITIPEHILASIFTNPATDENYDIDIRTRGLHPVLFV